MIIIHVICIIHMFVPHILYLTQLVKSDSSCDRKPRLKTDSVPSIFTRSKRDKPRYYTSCLACYERIIFDISMSSCGSWFVGLSGLLRVNSDGLESVLSRGFPVTRNCRLLETIGSFGCKIAAKLVVTNSKT